MTWTRTAATAAILLAVAQGAPLFADKLVVFKNGKALRAKSVMEDGRWLRCEFEDRNFISVPLREVAGVEEAAVGARDGDLRPNQVAAGSGGSYTGARSAPIQEPPIDQAEAPEANAEDLQAALAEENAQVQRGGFRANPGAGGRRGGIPQPVVTPLGTNQGLQTLNQGNPFPNQQGRTGLRQRGNFNRGNVTQVPQNQVQGEQGGDN